MAAPNVVSIDARIASVVAEPAVWNIVSRHARVININYRGVLISLVQPAVAYGPRQIRLSRLPNTNQELGDLFPICRATTFHCDLPSFAESCVNEKILLLAYQALCRVGRPARDCFSEALQKRLQSAILDLLKSLDERSDCTQAVNKLVGLGQGLTPSGDDFLCGLLLSGSCASSPYQTQMTSVKRSILGCEAQTHPVSFAFLADAMSGQVSQPVEILLSVLHGEALCTPHAALEAVTCLGHRSGFDILSGLIAGFRIPITWRNNLCPFIPY